MLEALKFRHRILLLVAVAAFALTMVTAMALVLGRRGVGEVSAIETRYLPLLELNLDLEATFFTVGQVLEKAASAGEESGLREADELRDRFMSVLSAGRQHIADNSGDPQELGRLFTAYYRIAREVSSELVSGLAADDVLHKAAVMRAAHQRVAMRLDADTAPDRTELARAFAAARSDYAAASRADLTVAGAAMALMLVLSWWIVRGAVRSLREVTRGVERLAEGDFSQEIPAAARDEFGDLARQANRTAVRLREYRELVEQDDWMKTGSGALAGELAGELTVPEVGGRALTYLARYLGASVGAAYAADEAGELKLLHSTAADSSRPLAVGGLRAGEGIAGRAARDGELCLISEPPPDAASVRSQSDAAGPRHIVAAPFAYEGRCMGVLELGFDEPPAAQALELLRRTRPALAVAFRVAESRQRVQSLVGEMQVQAEELRGAYAALQAHNEALQESEQQLQAQQEELQTANDELARQAEELESQHSAMVVKNAELQAAHRLIEQKASEVARASKYKSEFLANMSHELRTPLNSIMILARILGENEGGALAAKQVEFAQVIHRSGEELLNLINDILDLAKIESGKQEMVYGPVALRDVASYVRQMFEPLATQKGLALEIELADGLSEEIRTDQMRLEQILKNLVSNAIKFTERGRVGIRIYQPPADQRLPDADPDEEMIAIAVTDTGLGIPVDKQQAVFEAFAQADGGTSRKFGGTGLGLAIARQAAFRLGGAISLRSQPGLGSTFVLHLPTREPRRRPITSSAPPAAVATPAQPVRPPPGPLIADDGVALMPGEPWLLVIEDDPDFAGCLIDLIRQSGFPAVAAATGQQGLALATRYNPSGIILDIGLPDLDGWAVMERLQAERSTREIPVQFITAGGDAERARQMGAVGFLSKPADMRQVRTAIRTLQRAVGAPSHVLIAEPDASVRESLGGLLSGAGAAVEAVGSDQEALARLDDGPFDVMVLDLALPDKSTGMALLEGIRRRPALSSMPIVVYSGVALTADETRELTRGGGGVVVLDGERSTERVLDETRLFLHRVRAELPARRRRLIEIVHGRETVLEGKRVLIVDDDMRNLYSLTNALQAKRLQVTAAADGLEALEHLEGNGETDIVLMDIMMPRMDGHEAIRRIRQHPRFYRLPIIALTARTMPGERQKCLDAGATDFIPKPVDIDRLLSLLRVWLSPY